MHDPFQNYATLGSNYGMPTPYGLPYQGLQSPFNPAAGIQQLQPSPFAQLQQSPFGLQQSPFGQIGGQGLGQQNLQQALAAVLPQVVAALLSNPQIAASLQQGAFGSQIGQPYGIPQQSPYGQIGQGGSPFGQIGSPFGQVGSPLAPQSWIGQGSGLGQAHPLLSLLSARPFQGQGPTPWGY
jgi:hypothetical protein